MRGKKAAGRGDAGQEGRSNAAAPAQEKVAGGRGQKGRSSSRYARAEGRKVCRGRQHQPLLCEKAGGQRDAAAELEEADNHEEFRGVPAMDIARRAPVAATRPSLPPRHADSTPAIEVIVSRPAPFL